MRSSRHISRLVAEAIPRVPRRPCATSTSTTPAPSNPPLPVSRKRVLGLIAHIDSGKTTTTEAILHRCGALSRMGSVDTGDTATDHLPAERARGITVSSACVSADWREHSLTLVDSPGHLDFTYEVERALRAMDGAVVLLDGSRGIQPQTAAVWRQADANALPRLVFVNKLDMPAADFGAVAAQVEATFGVHAVPVSEPVHDGAGLLTGAHPVLATFPQDGGAPLHSKAQHKIMEVAAEHDDDVLAAWADGTTAPRDTVISALRAATLARSAVPVLAGAAARGIGTEHLLDSVVTFLPSPAEAPRVKGMHRFVAYAFKVVHDRRRGRLVFVRVFAVSPKSPRLPLKRCSLVNASRRATETPSAFLAIRADRYTPLDDVGVGDVFAAAGLRHTHTGDTLLLSSEGDDEDDTMSVLPGVRRPPAVFAVAVEPDEGGHDADLAAALEQVVDEDASLELRPDPRSGDTLLAGMGELHLQIALDAVRRRVPFDISASVPRVALRERVRAESVPPEQVTLDGGAVLEVSVERADSDDDNSIDVTFTRDVGAKLKKRQREEINTLLTQGAESVLGRGPLLGLPLVRAAVHIRVSDVPPSAQWRVIGMRALQARLAAQDFDIVEPVLDLRAARVPRAIVGDVIAELTHPTRRRGTVTDVADAGADGDADIEAVIPVQGMIGFATRFRSITKGAGDLTTTFRQYEPVDAATRKSILDSHP